MYTVHVMVCCYRERANLAITLAGKDDEVLAFGALFDYPTSANTVDAANWEEWIHANFECKLANVRLCVHDGCHSLVTLFSLSADEQSFLGIVCCKGWFQAGSTC